MIKIERKLTEKAQKAIVSLQKAEANNSSYNTPEVNLALKEMFHNKCYICENKQVTSYNIEHLHPHYKNKNLKKVISSNLKPKKYIFEEEACLQRQYAEKQKRNVERKQHQEQKQCYTEKQKQFPYEKKEQQEIKIQNQKWKN